MPPCFMTCIHTFLSKEVKMIGKYRNRLCQLFLALKSLTKHEVAAFKLYIPSNNNHHHNKSM